MRKFHRIHDVAVDRAAFASPPYMLSFSIMLILCLLLASHPAGGEEIPTEPELKTLVNTTMLDFALAIKAKDFTGFYQKIAKRWQAQITKEQLSDAFQPFIENEIDLTGLSAFEPVFPEDPVINRDGLLVLEGYYPSQPSVTYFTMKYLAEQGVWKLFGITVNLKRGPLSGQETRQMPDHDDLRALANTTILDFAVAVKARDFTGFYKNIAELWQSQTSAEALLAAFQSFIAKGIDLTVLEGIKPLFIATPSFNEHDWLVLQGHYPTLPSITYFTLEYLYEESDWKLATIDIEVTQDPPPAVYLKALVGNTMYDFALAVNAADFTEFYANVAKLWQERTTPEQLTEIFRPFWEQQIDLTLLQNMEPIFTEPPAVSENKVLTLQGEYATDPSKVYFSLEYLFEEVEWKLVGININVE